MWALMVAIFHVINHQDVRRCKSRWGGLRLAMGIITLCLFFPLKWCFEAFSKCPMPMKMEFFRKRWQFIRAYDDTRAFYNFFSILISPPSFLFSFSFEFPFHDDDGRDGRQPHNQQRHKNIKQDRCGCYQYLFYWSRPDMNMSWRRRLVSFSAGVSVPLQA